MVVVVGAGVVVVVGAGVVVVVGAVVVVVGRGLLASAPVGTRREASVAAVAA